MSKNKKYILLTRKLKEKRPWYKGGNIWEFENEEVEILGERKTMRDYHVYGSIEWREDVECLIKKSNGKTETAYKSDLFET